MVQHLSSKGARAHASARLLPCSPLPSDSHRGVCVNLELCRGRSAEEEAPGEVSPASQAGFRGTFVFLIGDTFAQSSICLEATVDSSGQRWRTALGFVLARPPPCCPGSAVAAPTATGAPCAHGARWEAGVRASGCPHSPAQPWAQRGPGRWSPPVSFFSQRSLKHASPLRLHAAGPLSLSVARRARLSGTRCRGGGWGASGGVALAGPDPQLAQRTRVHLCEAPALMNVSRCKPCPSRMRRSVSSNIRPQSCRVLAGRLCLAHAAQHASGRPARRTPSAGGWAARPPRCSACCSASAAPWAGAGDHVARSPPTLQ